MYMLVSKFVSVVSPGVQWNMANVDFLVSFFFMYSFAIFFKSKPSFLSW